MILKAVAIWNYLIMLLYFTLRRNYWSYL